MPVLFDDVEQSLGVDSLDRFEQALVSIQATGTSIRAIVSSLHIV